MAYEKFDPDKADFHIVAIKYNGNVKAIAEHFNVSRETIFQYFHRDPEGKKIIDLVRKYNTESDLDLAEYAVRYNLMNLKSNSALAQRAAELVIEKKGKSRGWIKEESSSIVPLQSDIDYVSMIAKLQNENAKLKKKIGKNDSNIDE